MPKLPSGVKKKSSRECSLAYIARQKERLGEQKYKANEAERQRHLWSEKRLRETEEQARARRQQQNKRKRDQRARAKAAKAANRRDEVPDEAGCVDGGNEPATTPQPADASSTAPQSLGRLSVQLFRRGRRATPGSRQNPQIIIEYASPAKQQSTDTPVTAPPPDETTPVHRAPAALRRLDMGAKEQSCRKSRAPTRGRGQDCTVTAHEYVQHGATYVSGNIAVQTRGIDDMNTHKPRVRDPMRDRQYHRNRKLREKHEKERLAFGTEQIKTARSQKLANEALSLVQRNINRIKSKKERKKAIHLLVSATEIKSKCMGAEFARMFNLTSRSILYTNKGRLKQKYTRSENTWHLIMWFQDPEHSITCAGKREKVVCRYKIDNKTIKMDKQKVILTEKLKTLHKVYTERFPERKCSLTFFQNVRHDSQFIKTLDHAKAQVCLCMQHQNFAMKMRGIAKFTKLSQNPDTLVREFTPDNFESKIREIANSLPPTVRYEEWKMTPVPHLDPKVKKCVKKLRPVPCELPRDNFVTMLVDQYPSICVHVQLATSQHRTVRFCET